MGIEPIDEMLDTASVRQVRTLLADSPAAMVVLGDVEGTVLWASWPGTSERGREASTLVGTNAFDYVHPDDRDHVRRMYDRAASGETVHYTCRAAAADGSWVSASTVAWGETGESGRIVVTISSAWFLDAAGTDAPGNEVSDPNGQG